VLIWNLGRDNGYSENFCPFISPSGKITHKKEIHHGRSMFGRWRMGEEVAVETGDCKGMKR
jgi:hypothetical protein